MRKAFFSVFAIAPVCVFAETVLYMLSMTLTVPRVYDNNQSLGYRRNQRQKIVARAYVDKTVLENGEPRIELRDCVNKTHKIAGYCVTYDDSEASDVTWRYIGSNKTGVFRNANISFCLDLDPSYNIGEDDPDNTLIVCLSGNGTTEKVIRGHVTGQIGCGCMAYGHTSPTRTVDGRVSDIVPISGTFTMRNVDSGRKSSCIINK